MAPLNCYVTYKLFFSVKSYGSGCNIAAIKNEWQCLKILVSHNLKDKTYSGLWETMLTKDPYKHDYKVGH